MYPNHIHSSTILHVLTAKYKGLPWENGFVLRAGCHFIPRTYLLSDGGSTASLPPPPNFCCWILLSKRSSGKLMIELDWEKPSVGQRRPEETRQEWQKDRRINRQVDTRAYRLDADRQAGIDRYEHWDRHAGRPRAQRQTGRRNRKARKVTRWSLSGRRDGQTSRRLRADREAETDGNNL